MAQVKPSLLSVGLVAGLVIMWPAPHTQVIAALLHFPFYLLEGTDSTDS